MVSAVCGLIPPAPAGAEGGAAAPGNAWAKAAGLMRAGKPRAALPLLDALHRAAPDLAAVKLELALAHFRLEQDADARRLFRQARSMRLTDGQRRAAGAYLARLRARNPWRFEISGGLVPQRNASRRTAADRITIGGFDFILDDRPESGIGLDVRAAAKYRRTVGGKAGLGFGATLQGKLFENRDWNDYTLTLDGHLSRGRIADGQTTLGLLIRPRWLSDRLYTTEIGPYLGYGRMLGEKTALGLRVERLERRAETPGRADAALWRVALTLGHRLSPQTSLRGGLSATLVRSPAATDAARIVSVTAGITRQFGHWRITVDAAHLRERRAGASTVFGIARDETENRLRLGIAGGKISVFGFSPVVEIGHEERRSNIAVYSWANDYAGLGFSRAF